MYDTIASDAVSSTELWACLAAVRALDDAIDELTVAVDEIRNLQGETTWRAKGVQKLQHALAMHVLSIPTHAERARDLRHRALAAVVV